MGNVKVFINRQEDIEHVFHIVGLAGAALRLQPACDAGGMHEAGEALQPGCAEPAVAAARAKAPTITTALAAVYVFAQDTGEHFHHLAEALHSKAPS